MPIHFTYPQEILKDILVLSVRKNFWASSECEIFPNRIYSRNLTRGPRCWGSSRNPINMLTLAIQGYLYYLRHKPKVILFGSAPRISGWFAWLKKVGLLPDVKLIAAGALYLDDTLSKYVDKLYVFSRDEIRVHDPGLREKYEFIPLSADGNYENLSSLDGNAYIFSGGGAGRDFSSLIEAVRGLDIHLKIVTFSPEKLAYTGDLPENCEIYWRMSLQSFLNLMAGAAFVVVPLKKGDTPHGHSTVVQAIRMGKAVITTRHSSIEDYVFDGENGTLVEPGNIDAYRTAIQDLWQNTELRKSFEDNALKKSPDLTYSIYARRLIDLCVQAIGTNAGI